jgi:hypothetical protein
MNPSTIVCYVEHNPVSEPGRLAVVECVVGRRKRP